MSKNTRKFKGPLVIANGVKYKIKVFSRVVLLLKKYLYRSFGNIDQSIRNDNLLNVTIEIISEDFYEHYIDVGCLCRR